MKKMFATAALCAALALPLGASASETLSAGLSGTIQSVSTNGPSAFQIGPAAATEGNPALNGAPGIFTFYSASAGLPQITGADLNKYGFSLYATPGTIGATSADYSGTFRIFAPGYGYTANNSDILEHGNFTATANFFNPYQANVTGMFYADPGTLQPAGWPVPVDFSAGNPAQFTGLFSSDANGGPQTLTGTLTTVPEPGSLAMLATMGLGSASMLLRRRRK